MLPILAALMVLAASCDDPSASTSAPSTSGAKASAAAAKPAQPPPRNRVGGTIALTDKADALLVAEEDRKALWRLPMPVTADSRGERFDMPGRPAQVLPLNERVLVTIRQPGLLLVLDEALAEQGRVALPQDAWGVAVTGDAKTAVVTSAWPHRVSGIDLDTMTVRWTVDVAREPRAVVIPKAANAPAYVTHLTRKALTRIDGLAGAKPKVTEVAFPTAPSVSPAQADVGATLAYSAVLSKDETRLYVPRHALGAVSGWWGANAVDVLDVGTDEPIAAEREGTYRAARLSDFVSDEGEVTGMMGVLYASSQNMDGPNGPVAFGGAGTFVQPRAAVYRSKTDTVLVASEGTDSLAELDAAFLEPGLAPLKHYQLGGGYNKAIRVAGWGGAPSGVALSLDESIAYVFCRTTSDVAVVTLGDVDEAHDALTTVLVRLAEEDPLLEGVAKTDPERKFREAAAIGRKLYYNAIDESVSGGMACAGCHPDGRDDGHVWHEVSAEVPFTEGKTELFIGGAPKIRHHHPDRGGTKFMVEHTLPKRGRARQTPMLAGRVRGEGPFGWRAESDTLVSRIDAGFRLHRWMTKSQKDAGAGGHAGALASFLLAGLVQPARPDELDEQQKRGQALFASDEVGCAACHMPEDKFSNWVAVKVKVPGKRRGFIDESGEAFKTPSLHHVGGTSPYYHDGSVSTLAELIEQNGNRMGNTAQLTEDDRAALVAYLETL